MYPEKWWDKLLQHVSEQPSGRTLKEYERYPKADYKDELVALYLLSSIGNWRNPFGAATTGKFVPISGAS